MSAQRGVPNRQGILGVWVPTGEYDRLLTGLRDAGAYLHENRQRFCDIDARYLEVILPVLSALTDADGPAA